MKQKSLYAGCLLFISYSITHAMDDDVIVGDINTGWWQIINYEGKELYLRDHILESKNNSNHPFSANSVFRVDVEKKKFIELDNVLTHNFTAADLNDINNGNWVFTPFYTNAKTHLIDKGSATIGALILGTQNRDIAEALFDTILEEQIQKINQWTLEQKKTKKSICLNE